MTQASHGKSVTSSERPAPTEFQSPPPADFHVATDRIPDAVAVLSYGTRGVGRLGGGPRIF